MAARHLPAPERLVTFLLLAGLVNFAIAGTPSMTPPEVAAPDYDQIIARIPGDRAIIAPVALAELNIALHRAKKQAAGALCQDSSFPDGELVQQLGPVLISPADSRTIWIYVAARRASPLACAHTSRAQFFQEMSRYLPAWVSIRPAGQLTVYQQGDAQPLPHNRLTSR